MERNSCNYSQHLPGRENVVTDCGSRDFHLSDTQLIAMLTPLHPSISPSQFKIIQLPEKHISWIASLAQKWPGKRELPKGLIKSTLAAGIAGWDSSTESESGMTPIWTPQMTLENYASAVLSCMRTEEVILGKPDPHSKSMEILPERPLTMWQRNLWQVTGSAPY